MAVGSSISISRPTENSTVSGIATETLWSVENLRMISIIGVVIFHATCYGNLATHPRAPGLDIFFVISGFLVWHLTNQRGYKSLQFIAHRFSRIFPLYAIMTCAMYAVAKAAPTIDMFHAGVFSPAELIRSLFFIPYTGIDGYRLPILAPGWTLNFDMYFFVIFAVVLLFRENRLMVCFAFFLAPALFHFLVRPPTSALTEMLVSTRSIAFLSGVFIADLLQKRRILPIAAAMLILIGAVFIFGMLCYFRVEYWRWGVLLWMLAPVAALYAFVCIEFHAVSWMKLPWCEKIGKWSYSIYLIHIFIVPFTMSMPFSFLIDILVTLITSIYAGSLLNRYVERPINRVAKSLEIYFSRKDRRADLRYGLGK